MPLYRVDAMEELIRTALEAPLQAHITSVVILQAFNAGYRDVSALAFCIENEDMVNTVPGNRLAPFIGHKVNYVGVISKETTTLIEGGITIIDNWYDIAISSDGKYQAAVLTNKVYVSSDYGVTWSIKLAIAATWRKVAVSSNGQHQTVLGPTTWPYVSSDYGQTWEQKGVQAGWRIVDISSSGQYQVASGVHGIYTSSDYGQNWTLRFASDTRGIAMTSTGQYQIASTSLGVYISSNYGTTWSITSALAGVFSRFSVSSTGQYRTAVDYYSGPLRVSSDYGASWGNKGISTTYRAAEMSSNGMYQIACGPNYIYVSSDYGQNWTQRGPDKNWYGVAISSDGKLQTAVVFGDYIYFSSDYGVTWNNFQYISTTVSDYTVANSMLKVSPTALGRISINNYIPMYWFQWGNYVVIEPVPDAVYSLKLFISDYPTPELTATTDYPASLPDEFHPCIIDYACYLLSLRMKKWKKAAKYYNLYIKNLKQRKKDYMDRQADRQKLHSMPDRVIYPARPRQEKLLE